jgi:hypothetical protein
MANVKKKRSSKKKMKIKSTFRKKNKNLRTSTIRNIKNKIKKKAPKRKKMKGGQSGDNNPETAVEENNKVGEPVGEPVAEPENNVENVDESEAQTPSEAPVENEISEEEYVNKFMEVNDDNYDSDAVNEESKETTILKDKILNPFNNFLDIILNEKLVETIKKKEGSSFTDDIATQQKKLKTDLSNAIDTISNTDEKIYENVDDMTSPKMINKNEKKIDKSKVNTKFKSDMELLKSIKKITNVKSTLDKIRGKNDSIEQYKNLLVNLNDKTNKKNFVSAIKKVFYKYKNQDDELTNEFKKVGGNFYKIENIFKTIAKIMEQNKVSSSNDETNEQPTDVSPDDLLDKFDSYIDEVDNLRKILNDTEDNTKDRKEQITDDLIKDFVNKSDELYTVTQSDDAIKKIFRSFPQIKNEQQLKKNTMSATTKGKNVKIAENNISFFLTKIKREKEIEKFFTDLKEKFTDNTTKIDKIKTKIDTIITEEKEKKENEEQEEQAEKDELNNLDDVEEEKDDTKKKGFSLFGSKKESSEKPPKPSSDVIQATDKVAKEVHGVKQEIKNQNKSSLNFGLPKLDDKEPDCPPPPQPDNTTITISAPPGFTVGEPTGGPNMRNKILALSTSNKGAEEAAQKNKETDVKKGGKKSKKHRRFKLRKRTRRRNREKKNKN